MKLSKSIVLIWCCFLLSVAPVKAGSIKTFDVHDYTQILAERKGKAFILVFWSIDCAPCHKELAMLGKLKLQKPQLQLVLVATDAEVEISELEQTLRRHNLQNLNSYVFANSPAQAIRYAIDPGWYGELPRSYLFDADHQRKAVSGLLSSRQLSERF